MKIGIVCAMQEEFELISNDIKDKSLIKKLNLEFISGNLNGKKIIGVICGIGKVNSAICTQILISEFKCTHIINSGVAGGINKNIKFKDVVIANDLIQHDVNICNFGYKLGEIPNIGTYSFKCDGYLVELAKSICEDISKNKADFKFHIGRIITGDQFISNDEISNKLQNEFNALACEMESAAIAQTCYLNNIPYIIIRSISDNGGNIAGDEFYKFLKDASKNSYLILKQIISRMEK